jgi:hypothetical protein
MSERKRLYDEYEKKLKQLQDECKHHQLNDWVDEWFAIGHSTGFMVKECVICGRIIHRQTSCFKCGMIITDDQIHKGDGKTLPLGASYCEVCVNQAKKTK